MTFSVDEAYQIFLNDVYKPFQNKPALDSNDSDLICPTYGELYYPSILKLIESCSLKEEDVFLDLGSGMGKLALTVYLRSLSKHVIGIEAVEMYHQKGIDVLHQLKDSTQGMFSKGQLDLIWGNFLDFDFNQASVVYSCSTCFSQDLLWHIGKKLNESTHVKQVLTLKPISNFIRLPLKQVISVECSWDSALCYHYAH